MRKTLLIALSAHAMRIKFNNKLQKCIKRMSATK